MTSYEESNIQWQKQPEETDGDYIRRVAFLKKASGLSWRQFAAFVEKVSGVRRDESCFRRVVKSTANVEPQASSDDQLAQLNEVLQNIQKARVKLSDERTQNNAFIRRIAREETIAEIAASFAKEMTEKKPLDFNPQFDYLSRETCNEAILLISDWHFGLEFENAFNRFNPEICRIRVSKLVRETIKRCKENGVSKITVLNLSDLIAGRIHTQIRIQSREDVITQTMEVSEILAEMLCKLSETMSVVYYDCLDNHSRIEQNKSESLDLESLTRFIPFYLKPRLQGKDIQIMDNTFSEDIIVCNVNGHNVVGVHGDKDKPITALDKITLLTRRSYDLMCTAHLHHFSADEKCGCITIGNGSLMGTDDYAMNLRLHSEPSQTLIISTPENVCDTIYKINLS